MKVLVYTITFYSFCGIKGVKEMIRYSRDRPATDDWLSGTTNKIQMRRFLPRGRIKLFREFFYVQVERRWQSFGCEVTDIHDEEANIEDKEYWENAGWKKYE